MGRVLVLGSLNVDLVTHVDRHPQPGETVLGNGLERLAGGKGANQAVAAAGAGAETLMVARSATTRPVGVRREAASSGVDVSRLATVPGPTGTALIVVDEAGENTIVVVPGANGEVGRTASRRSTPPGPGDVLLVQLEIPLETVADGCARAAAARRARRAQRWRRTPTCPPT